MYIKIDTSNYFLFSTLLYTYDLKEILDYAREISKLEKRINSPEWRFKSTNRDMTKRFDLIATKSEKIDLLKLKWTIAIANISASAFNNKASLNCEIGKEIIRFSNENKEFFEFIKKYRNLRSHYVGNNSHETTKVISELLNKNVINIKKNNSGFLDIMIESISLDEYLLEKYDIDFDLIIQFHDLIISYILKHL